MGKNLIINNSDFSAVSIGIVDDNAPNPELPNNVINATFGTILNNEENFVIDKRVVQLYGCTGQTQSVTMSKFKKCIVFDATKYKGISVTGSFSGYGVFWGNDQWDVESTKTIEEQASCLYGRTRFTMTSKNLTDIERAYENNEGVSAGLTEPTHVSFAINALNGDSVSWELIPI